MVRFPGSLQTLLGAETRLFAFAAEREFVGRAFHLVAPWIAARRVERTPGPGDLGRHLNFGTRTHVFAIFAPVYLQRFLVLGAWLGLELVLIWLVLVLVVVISVLVIGSSNISSGIGN